GGRNTGPASARSLHRFARRTLAIPIRLPPSWPAGCPLLPLRFRRSALRLRGHRGSVRRLRFPVRSSRCTPGGAFPRRLLVKGNFGDFADLHHGQRGLSSRTWPAIRSFPWPSFQRRQTIASIADKFADAIAAIHVHEQGIHLIGEPSYPH